ncbi:STAS domain-containing protein [Streptomyces sp. ACA25]|uniref:STAS domain-containing protein n=1 Tax=Streptomyces sp. ACA25 TaxID=3022596 RepID=UPI002307454A|nr:STAS domain-containing protein [Streptomyces sp. ACA25]MDB1086118.1 STAS domain-containing protein [Streptomyces sp. ACA25]
MNELTIATRDAATGPVLEITGDLDHRNAAHLRRSVESLALGQGQLLVLDLARLTFCDSSGITAFLFARNRAKAARADIALAAVPPNTARVFGIIGLDQIFVRYPDADAATAARAAHP